VVSSRVDQPRLLNLNSSTSLAGPCRRRWLYDSISMLFEGVARRSAHRSVPGISALEPSSTFYVLRRGPAGTAAAAAPAGRRSKRVP